MELVLLEQVAPIHQQYHPVHDIKSHLPNVLMGHPVKLQQCHRLYVYLRVHGLRKDAI